MVCCRLYFNFQSLVDYGEQDALTELLNRKTLDGDFLDANVEKKRLEDTLMAARRTPAEAGHYWLTIIDIIKLL